MNPRTGDPLVTSNLWNYILFSLYILYCGLLHTSTSVMADCIVITTRLADYHFLSFSCRSDRLESMWSNHTMVKLFTDHLVDKPVRVQSIRPYWSMSAGQLWVVRLISESGSLENLAIFAVYVCRHMTVHACVCVQCS